MKTIKVLVPEYLKDFRCIGSDCENTCCQHWSISIDKNTYKKYKQLKNTDFYPLADKKIILNRDKKSSYHYAKINLDANDYCPFLNEDLLCGIYNRLGESFMPLICKSYPRFINKLDDVVEVSLLLSCPEAARKALLPTESMAFEYLDLEHQDIYDKIFNVLITKAEIVKKEEHRDFWNIRIAAISILQNRKFDIVNRLMLIGLMYHRIQQCIDDKKYDRIRHEISDYVNQVEALDGQDIFADLPKNVLLQTSLSKIAIEKKRIGNRLSEQLLSYIDDAMSILGTDQDDVENTSGELSTCLSESILEEFQQILQEQVIPFLENDGMTIMENFLVNYFFLEMMPFGDYETIHDSLIILCSHYMSIKALLAGQAKKAPLTRSQMFDILYLFARGLMHDTSYNRFILNIVKASETDSLGGLYTLIFS